MSASPSEAPPSTTAAADGSAVAPRRRLRRTAIAPRGDLGLPLAVAVTILVQVTFMPFLQIADGIPDIVAPLVVGIALLRGPLVGAVAGFAAGLGIELIAPIGTLGVLALLYLVVGAYVGRYSGRAESRRLLPPVVLSVAAALAVQLGYAAVQLLLGTTMPASTFVGSVLIPTLALTALLSPPMLLATRRAVGQAAPRSALVSP